MILSCIKSIPRKVANVSHGYKSYMEKQKCNTKGDVINRLHVYSLTIFNLVGTTRIPSVGPTRSQLDQRGPSWDDPVTFKWALIWTMMDEYVTIPRISFISGAEASWKRPSRRDGNKVSFIDQIWFFLDLNNSPFFEYSLYPITFPHVIVIQGLQRLISFLMVGC